eukprot:TRINITY_DN3796_c0_g1_i1.p6 TRINITY_DN3796_c0_g1~~TRINITY_DN3796_c0_g1_i1.p6  ORF type:complete len:69 (+),score=16.70 TRINITY_DN3796_c0_g1_i1:127-333(+)
MGALDEAIGWYCEAIHRCETYSVAHGNLANCYKEKGRLADVALPTRTTLPASQTTCECPAGLLAAGSQ